jgi:2'-5' RNA ligase
MLQNRSVNFGLGIPLPRDYAGRIELFRAEKAEWAIRPMRSDPHISIKGPAGLGDSAALIAIVDEIARSTERFSIRLNGPAIFKGESILYLGVDSLGWWRLHRTLVDTIAAKTGAEMYPLERRGWIPHATVIRLKPELQSRHQEILSAASDALSPFPVFEVDALRMYRQERPDARWTPFYDFPIST